MDIGQIKDELSRINSSLRRVMCHCNIYGSDIAVILVRVRDDLDGVLE